MVSFLAAVQRIVSSIGALILLPLTGLAFAQSPPTNLQSTCNSTATQITISWAAPASGADAYAPRLNFLANDGPACQDGWLCSGDSRDWYSNNFAATTHVANVETGKAYSFWVHTLQGGVASPASAINFTCSAATPPPPGGTGNLITNAGFEQTVVTNSSWANTYGVCGYFDLNMVTSGWSFSGGAGVQRNGSCWGTSAPEGQQTAVFQNLGQGTTTLNLNPGQHSLTFKAANRTNYGGQQSLSVRLDGNTLSTFSPSSAFTSYSIPFTIGSAGAHTITFAGQSGGPDNSAFVDDIVLTRSAVVSSTVQICSKTSGAAVYANNTGSANAASQIQECLDGASLSDQGVWEIPKGVYRIEKSLRISRPIIWRSQGTFDTATCVYNDTTGTSCAILKADANITGTDAETVITDTGAVIKRYRTMLLIRGVDDVTLDHLIIDGNRAERVGDPASEPRAAFCADTAAGGNYTGANALFDYSNRATVTRSVTRNAVCGSAMVISGNGASVNNTYFYANGNRTGNLSSRWADGLTLGFCNDCVVYNNNFTNNTDVSLVFGGGQRTSIVGNYFQQWDQNVFAAMAFSNFFGTTSGNFVDTAAVPPIQTTFSDNIIACGAQKCTFGINIGEYAWYPFLADKITPTPRTKGGLVTRNTISGATVGIHINGAGTGLPGEPERTKVYGNAVSGSPAIADVRACANQAVGNKVYWLANSSIDTNGETDFVSTNLSGCIQ